MTPMTRYGGNYVASTAEQVIDEATYLPMRCTKPFSACCFWYHFCMSCTMAQPLSTCNAPSHSGCFFDGHSLPIGLSTPLRVSGCLLGLKS